MCLAVPGQLLSIEGETSLTRQGWVDFGGVKKKVNLAYVPKAVVGDYVVVHVGFALAKIDEAEASRIFDYIDSLEQGKPLPLDHPQVKEEGAHEIRR
jgi:hydrogenase expression/formation protein HypC